MWIDEQEVKLSVRGGWTVGVLLLAVGVYGSIPDGYILDIRPSCGTNDATDASVAVVTDLPDAKISANCRNGKFNFNNVDGVNFNLPVSFTEQINQCIFTKRKDSRVYFLLMYVAYGEGSGRVQQGEEYFTVTCTFDPNGAKYSADQQMDESLVAPTEIQDNNGPDASSSLTLTLADILGFDLSPDEYVPMRRMISLKLVTDGSSSEGGVRPVSCVAIGPASGSTYSVLRAGCGDGIVFPRHSGFEAKDLVSFSPYFESFTVDGDDEILFECNVTVCSSSCNGNSCVAGRKKRSLNEAEPMRMLKVKSSPFRMRQG